MLLMHSPAKLKICIATIVYMQYIYFTAKELVTFLKTIIKPA